MEIITAFDIYLIMTATQIVKFLLISGKMIIALATLWLFISLVCGLEDGKAITGFFRYKNAFRTAGFGFVLVLVSAFTPNTKTLAMMYAIPPVLNNEQVQKMPENLVKSLNTLMENFQADVTRETQEKTND